MTQRATLTVKEMQAISDVDGLVLAIRTRHVKLDERHSSDCSMVPEELARAVMRVGVEPAFRAILAMENHGPDNRLRLRLCRFMLRIVLIGTEADVLAGLELGCEMWDEAVSDFWEDEAICGTVLAAVERADPAIYRHVANWFNGFGTGYTPSDMILDRIYQVADGDPVLVGWAAICDA
jgi:hypothetical protein